MTSKKFLALLMAASLAFQQAIIAADDSLPSPSDVPTVIAEAVTSVASSVAEKADAVAEQVSKTLDEVVPAAVDAAEETVDAVVEAVTPDTAPETSENPNLSNMHVLGLRCVMFFVAKNIVRIIMKAGYNKESAAGKKDDYSSLKAGSFALDSYLGHALTYGMNTILPYQDDHEVTDAMKGAEFLAKEISIVGAEKKAGPNIFGKDGYISADSLTSLQDWTKIALKALNRNQLFVLPANVKAVLKNDLVRMTTGMLEGLAVFGDDNAFKFTEYETDGSVKTPGTIDTKRCASAFIYGQIALRSGNLAKDLLLALAMNGQLPEAVANFMETETGKTLVEDVLAQIIEDSVNSTFSATGLHG